MAAGRRVIYIKNPSSGSHFRVLGGGSKGPPLKPPKPPKPPYVPPVKPPTQPGQDYRPPKPPALKPPIYDLPTAPTMHSAGYALTGGSNNLPAFSPLAEFIGLSTLPVGVGIAEAVSSIMIGGTAMGGAQFGALFLASALIAGYTIPMLPGWGQPISFFSVLNVENGASHNNSIPFDNLVAAWAEVNAGLNFTPPVASVRPLSPGQNLSSEDAYYQTAARAGMINPPPPNYDSIGNAFAREVWRLRTGQGFTKASEQMNYSSSNNGNSLFSP